MNGKRYGTDYVPGPGESFLGEEPGEYIISTHNIYGRSEEDIRREEMKIAEDLPEGATLERHQNADGSITIIERYKRRER